MTEKESISSCTLLHTVFSDSLLKSLSDYHTFLHRLTQLCLSDSKENIFLSGSAYDTLPPFYKLFDFGCGQITAKPSLRAQYALTINKCCAVLQDPAIDYDDEYRVLLYATSAKQYDGRFDASMVTLHVSSRIHCMVQQEDLKSSICQSIVVRNDLCKTPVYYLSSQKYSTHFHSSSTQLLLYHLPAVKLDFHHVCADRSHMDSNMVPPDDQFSIENTGLWQDSDKLNIGAIKRIPVFRCLDWPLCSLAWTTRVRFWPNNTLVQDVIKSPVFLKPAPQEEFMCNESHSDQEDHAAQIADLLWVYDFSAPEACLLAHISTDTKRVFFLLQSLADDSPELYRALKHVLLWCVEEYGPDLENKASSLSGKLMLVIAKLERFVSDGGVPHYFIPECIILDPGSISTSLISQLFGVEKSHLHEMLLETTGMGALRHVKDLTFCSNIMFQNMQAKLYFTAEYNATMLCMQLYQKLHGFSTIWKSIESHHQTLDALIKQGDLQCPGIHKAVIDFVQSSLGWMYFVQGVQAHYKQEKTTFFNKAKEHFGAVKNSGMVLNKLREAMMLLKREEYQLVLSLVEGLFSKLYTEVLANELEENIPKYLTDVQFLAGLENAATYAILTMDFLAMTVEKPGLPKEIATNLSLAEFQLLGYTSRPVAVLDTTVLCGVIVSYCYSGLKMYADAKTALQKVEGMSLKDELDLNERRGCFYLNIIAHAYKKAKDIDQARYLLERSVTIMSSARNPGRWALVSLNSRKMKEFIWGGIGVAMATTVAAITLNFVFGKR